MSKQASMLQFLGGGGTGARSLRDKGPSSSAPAGKLKSTAKPASKAVQMHLDLGQKDFALVRCAHCGMVYAPGDAGDEALHRAQHDATEATLRFPGWSSERVVLDQGSATGRLLLVQPGDPAPHLKKVAELCTYLEQAMGLEAGWVLGSGWGSSKGSSGTKGSGGWKRPGRTVVGAETMQASGSGSGGTAPSSCRVFVFVGPGKQVAGCLVAERITCAEPAAVHAPPPASLQSEGPHTSVGRHQEGSVEGHTVIPVVSPVLSPPHSHQSVAGMQPERAAKRPRTSCDRQGVIAGAVQGAGRNGGSTESGHGGGGTASAAEDPSTSMTGACSAGACTSVAAMLGVRALWVAPRARRRRVAMRMLDVARCHMAAGYVIPRTQVAFAAGPLLGAEAAAFAHTYMAPEGACVLEYA